MKLNYRLFGLVFVFVLVISFVYCLQPIITIDESSYVLDRGIVLDLEANGTISIFNPSLNDEIYEFVLEFRVDESLDFFVTNITNSSGRFIVERDRIYGRSIFPNETIVLNYYMEGRVNSKFEDDLKKDSVLNWYVSDYRLEPMRYVTLSKLERSNPSVNVSPRRVVVEGENPTDFDVILKFLDVFKTSSVNWSDMFFAKTNLYSVYDMSLSPYQNFNFDVIDAFSDDKTIYWLDYDIRTVNDVVVNSDVEFVKRVLSGNKKDDDLDLDLVDDDVLDLKDLVVLKEVNQTFVSRGDVVEVKLRIENLNEIDVSDLELVDKIPSVFKLAAFDNESNLLSSVLYRLEIAILEGEESLEFSYKMKFAQDTDEKLIYLAPAVLKYKDSEVYSNSVVLVNENFVKKGRILVEKEVDVLENDSKKIMIRVTNVGSVDLRDVVIIEDMANQSVIVPIDLRDVSFARWVIDFLDVGEEWEVSYEVQDKNVNKYIPEVYGVDDVEVYKTLFLDEEVYDIYDGEPNWILKGLAILAIILLIIDIVF